MTRGTVANSSFPAQPRPVGKPPGRFSSSFKRRGGTLPAFFLLALLAGCGSGSGSSGNNPGSGGQASGTGGTSGGTGGSGGSGGNGTATGGSGTGGMAGRAGTGGSGTGGEGVAPGGSGGGAGSGGIGTGGRGGTGVGTGGAGGTTGGGVAAFNPGRGIITGVRGVAAPAATQILKLHNPGQGPLSVTALTISGTNATLFQLVSPPPLPAAIAPGGDLTITVQLLTASANLPTAPAQDSGATALTATLNATLASGSTTVGLYGLVLTMAIWEPTLGQILNTLGYRNNVGLAQNNSNPNRGGTVQQLPGVEAATDEIAAPRFQKAGAGVVTLLPVARFSPRGALPFGWYASGSLANCGGPPPATSATCNMVGSMAQVTNGQTSDGARMVMPPVTGAGTFDPGAQSFGVWMFSDQMSKLYPDDVAGATATNGDYDYSEDAPNSPANVHRTKVYPLRDAAGALVPASYLLAVEEAANGDYQDYVFVLTNAKVAP